MKRSWWKRLRCVLGFHTGPYREADSDDYIPTMHCGGCGRDFEL